jgi:four helix bundle protein
MKVFRFLEWEVYRDAKEFFKIVYNITSKLPKDVKYELGSQITRSAFSVALNIAEGSGKSSDKELNRYFDISIGSLNETVAGLDILKDNKLLDEGNFNGLVDRAQIISRQLGGFKKKLGS